MRMNVLVAARTELAMSVIVTGMVGEKLAVGQMTILGFAFAFWGMALNNSGWIVIGGYSAPYLKSGVNTMKRNFNEN